MLCSGRISPVRLFQTSDSSSLISHTAFTSIVSVRSYIACFVLLSLQNTVPQAPGFVLALCPVTDLAGLFVSVVVTLPDSLVPCMFVLCKRGTVQIGSEGYSSAVMHFNLQ